MSQPWMPFYVADYLADTTHLSAAEHGAYLLLIMHYWRAGSLPTDERQLQRIARMTVREWSNSRDTLASFFDADWRHKRIENELLKSQLKSTARAEAGSRGGKAKALKNNDAGLANATILPEQKPAVALASSSQSQPHKEKPKPNGFVKKGCRLPDDWYPSKEDLEFASKMIGPTRGAEEWAKFEDYWRSVPGQKGVKLDWDATWRNWVRKAAEQHPRGQPPPKQKYTYVDAANEILAEMRENERTQNQGPDSDVQRLSDLGGRHEASVEYLPPPRLRTV